MFQDFAALVPSHLLFTLLLEDLYLQVTPEVVPSPLSQYGDVHHLCSTCLNLKVYTNLTIYCVFPQLYCRLHKAEKVLFSS